MGFPVELATIVTLFVESVCWGINLVSFFICMGTLLLSDGHLKPLPTVNYISLVAALLMFSIATFDIAVVVSRNIEWFVDANTKTMPSGSGVSNWWSVAEISNFIAQTFIGDAILIYRCFVIWSRRWLVIVFPVITWLAGAACGISGLIIGSTTFYAMNRGPMKPFLTSLIVLSAVTNFTSSSLIVFCIWSVHRHSARYYHRSVPGRDPLARAIRITIESGGLYTISMLILLVTYSTGHNSQIIVARAIVQIIGITFNLIIGRNARRKDTFMTPSSRRGTLTSTPGQMSIKTHVLVSRDEPKRSSGGGSGSSTLSEAEKRTNCG
ncbi:hypothetical protein BDZ94DRAFT_296847 [Collybia nuda]|uniref:Uncharacterized protein n=1 Tax=Collybia nuda TaxID=64659 RepID=A0A9P5YBL6_9AGAR|nr:hypothetical protein BDZ94DRAFT_296847 [Collybia nuda]